MFPVFASADLPGLLGAEPNSAIYRERAFELFDEPERAIVHAGFPLMMIMDDLDDNLDFGYSGDWEVGIGETGSLTTACALGGGYTINATRTGYREVEATIQADNCKTELGTFNGSVSATYDDEIWSAAVNPKTEYALKFKFQGFTVVANDSKTYVYSGSASCDSVINQPLITLTVLQPGAASSEVRYGRAPNKDPASYYPIGYLPTDGNGAVADSYPEEKWNCDILNTSVAVGGDTHRIEAVKFSATEGLYGDSAWGRYTVSAARSTRLQVIGSGLYDSANPGGMGRFRHSQFGPVLVQSGRPSLSGDFAFRTCQSGGCPWLELAFYTNSSQNSNDWDFRRSRLAGGDSSWNGPDLNEDGSDYLETIPGAFFVSRGECAMQAIGDHFHGVPDPYAINFFEFSRRPATVQETGLGYPDSFCSSKNHWLFVDDDGGSFFYQGRDFDGDLVHDYYDDDDDNDGVPDLTDAFPENPSESKDNDGDGIGNNADKDDDNDGVNDLLDAFPLDPSEDRDSDEDGIGNNADTDDDNDGFLDHLDSFPLDPTEHMDTDKDGIGNNSDVDDDNDGATDAVEDAYGTDPLVQDTDGDSVSDGYEILNGYNPLEDDCPRYICTKLSTVIWAAVGSSFDLDRDGLTNGKEKVLATNWQRYDSDGDGLGDGEEVKRATNPLISDTDGDGLSDGNEIARATNPLLADTDGDGLSDGDEIARETNPLLADSDGDSMLDGEEVSEGLDPNDSEDCPKWYCGSGVMNIIPAIVP